jgi:hypothetical protein
MLTVGAMVRLIAKGGSDRTMRWPQWYPTRAEVMGILFALVLALQLPYLAISESMGNHDSDIVDADGVG